MVTSPTPVPPRREGRRLTIPTPADLLHPLQRRLTEATSNPREPAAPAAPEDETGPPDGAAEHPENPTAEAHRPQTPHDTPDAARAVPPHPREPAPTAGLVMPTPATLRGLPEQQRVRPEATPLTSAATTPPTAPAAPPERLEPSQDQANPPPTPATLPRPTRQTVDTPVAPDGAAAPDAPSRRIFPNPASLMSAGRGARKVRQAGLRARRLPKVEETSAGGVVLDLSCSPAAVALIARHDRRSRLLWSLPKGHVEHGETPEETALREVHEETGLLGRIVAPLGVIDFWFVVEDKRIHKTVHHFVIEAIGGELSDEDIEVEAVEWVPYHEVVRKLAYGDERRLVEKVAQIVPGVM